MTPDEIAALFTRSDDSYLFARWGRPIAPVVFGVTDETLAVVKGATEAVAALAGIEVAETDPELGSNLMVFFFTDWDELPEVPDLGNLVPDLVPLVGRLKEADANQYRVFRFDEAGAIKACFVFVRMDAHLSETPAETLALSQMVQTVLLWSDRAFMETSSLAVLPEGGVILNPEIANVIRAAYNPVLPAVAQDASHALRLFARMETPQ
jgi:hypothetical protein